MATAGITIHYREDVSDKAAAERVLKPHPPRAYISWRVGTSDDQFVVSYNSAAFNRTEHVALRRLPSGSFQPSQSVGEDASRPYDTLAEFIATRRYIDVAKAVSTVPAGSGNSSSELHRRNTGAPSAPALGGRAEVPAELPLPVPKASGTEADEEALIIHPTCSHGTQKALFGVCIVLAGVLAAWTYREFGHHESLVVQQAAALAATATSAVAEATTGLKQALLAAGPPGAQDLSACSAAAAAWRAGVAHAKAAVEPDFATGEAPLFIRHLLGLAAIAFGCAWGLLWITTGRRMDSDAESASSAGIDDDMDSAAAMARINSASGKRTPVMSRMQGLWALAFWGMVGAGTYSGTLVFHTLWDYANVGGAVVKAARPLSLRFRCGNLTAPASGAGSPYYGGSDGIWPTDELGLPQWRAGDTCAGVRALSLSQPCADAIQPFLSGLLDMPPMLTLPITRILPLPHALVAALLPSADASPLVHPHGSRAATIDDIFDDELTLADPFAGTRLAGWFDGPHLVVPSPQGLAFAVLDVLCVLVFTYMATLFLREGLSQNMPRLRAWWARRGGALARGGAGKPKAHRD